ncbi:hypothetical protein OG607_24755 [Streptomyces sp. NBC_01537]|uniref:hypothetical protein n=1 Tax=Streptomyces sp. NBC_01537 TaxID=2903896 RepID=UPI00386888E8
MEELREDRDDGTVARVAAIDIAKASGMVCLRVPHDTRTIQSGAKNTAGPAGRGNP